MSLYTFHRFKEPSRDDLKPAAYCSISHDLQECAVAVLNTFQWLQDEMDTHSWKDDAQTHYKSRLVAEERAQVLRNLNLQKRDGAERPADDVAYKDLLVEETSWLKCTVGELLVNEADIHALATVVANAPLGSFVTIEKRIRKLAKAFVSLFDGCLQIDPIAGYETAEITREIEDWAGEVVRRHHAVMSFLRNFEARCASEPPKAPPYNGPVHTVHIEDLNTITVDGAPVKLNAARKAALFALAIIGTEAITTELFAENYGGASTGSNYANTFQQGIAGLKKNLPHLTVSKPELHQRTINGLKLTCDVLKDDLVESLRLRRR